MVRIVNKIQNNNTFLRFGAFQATFLCLKSTLFISGKITEVFFIAAAEIMHIIPSAHGSDFFDLPAVLTQQLACRIEPDLIKIFDGSTVPASPEDLLDVVGRKTGEFRNFPDGKIAPVIIFPYAGSDQFRRSWLSIFACYQQIMQCGKQKSHQQPGVFQVRGRSIIGLRKGGRQFGIVHAGYPQIRR